MRLANWVMAMMTIAGACLAALGAAPPASQPAKYDAKFDILAHYNGPWTQENLDRITKALAVPETRLAALRELIDFAGPTMYQVGSVIWVYSDGSGPLRDKATALAHAAADEATVLKALDSSDSNLVRWGIWHVGAVKDRNSVLPKLKEIAQGKDENLRSEVLTYLRSNGGADFIPQLAETEKSAYVLDEILFAGDGNEPTFNRKLCDLLKDNDLDVRKRAITYIGSNAAAAPSRHIWINSAIMDGLLADAQPGHAEAAFALSVFQTYTNAQEMPNVEAAAAWWKAHRVDWELGRFPRFEIPTRPEIYASITTAGQVGGTPGWKATITLENHGKRDEPVNLRSISSLNWSLYDGTGNRVQLPYPQVNAAPWTELKPGESVRQDSPIKFEPGPLLIPGRYTLVAELDLNIDRKGAPLDVALTEGQIALPAIIVEVVSSKN